jgi:hypothetical protein
MSEDNNNDTKNLDEEFKKNLSHYRQVMAYMGANVPVEVLCLPKPIESALLKEGFTRVYDLINHDLSKIKGIGKTRLSLLSARLDEFFTVSI